MQVPPAPNLGSHAAHGSVHRWHGASIASWPTTERMRSCDGSTTRSGTPGMTMRWMTSSPRTSSFAGRSDGQLGVDPNGGRTGTWSDWALPTSTMRSSTSCATRAERRRGSFCSGHHVGPLLGIVGTGRPFQYSAAAFFACEHDRLVEAWVLGDLEGLRRQLAEP